jgi:hypothetical protein
MLNARAFIAQLDEVIGRDEIKPFFCRYPRRPASRGID